MRKFVVTLDSINEFRTSVRNAKASNYLLTAQEVRIYVQAYGMAAEAQNITQEGICFATFQAMQALKSNPSLCEDSYAMTEGMFWHVTGEWSVFPLKGEARYTRPMWAKAFSEALCTGVLEVTGEMAASLKHPISSKFEVED